MKKQFPNLDQLFATHVWQVKKRDSACSQNNLPHPLHDYPKTQMLIKPPQVSFWPPVKVSVSRDE